MLQCAGMHDGNFYQIIASAVGPGMLQQGSVWGSLEELKMEVKDHAISNHVELRVLKADKKRYPLPIFKCILFFSLLNSFVF